MLLDCKDCAKRKSPKKTRTVPLKPIVANEPLEIVGIDFVGPLPLTPGGNRYVMTFQNHFTRWPAAYSLPQAREEEVIQYIQAFSRDFGYPRSILSDRGSAFLSDLVKKACKKLKINHSPTSAYHPQANGLCERFHSTLKTSLSLVINKGKNDWDEFLHDMVAAYRTTPHSVTKETPAFLISKSRRAGEKKSGLDREHWMGPFTVEEILSEENVRLNMDNSKRHPVVNVNRLKIDEADNLKRRTESVTRILDKMRTRNEKGRLESKTGRQFGSLTIF